MAKRVRYLKLKYLRERMEHNQIVYADLLGISLGQYCKKETGRQPWYLSECEILRDYINKWLKKKGEEEMTIDDIFFGEEVSNKTQKAM